MFGLTPEEEEQQTGGSIADQLSAPMAPMAPPPAAQAPGPEAPSPLPAPPPGVPGPDDVMPPSPGTLPVPSPLPQVAPVTPQLPPPIPTGRVVSPAEAANLGAIDQNTKDRMATTQQAGQVATAAAGAKADAASNDLAAQQQFVAERQRIADDATKRIQEREAQANADYQQYKNFQLKDPDADKSFGRKLLEAIAVTLGAYGSGLTHTPNQAYEMISSANKENIDRQKAQQEKLFQVAQHSDKDVEAARQERDDAFKQLDLKHSALLESSAAALRAQLTKIGVPQAQIDANSDVQKLEADALKLREGTLQSIRNDETTLAKADISAAARRARAAAAGGGGLGAESQLAAYLEQHPGDMAGAYALGAKLHMNRMAVDDTFAREKEQRAGARTTADKFASENGLNAISKQQRELAELSKALKDNAGNPLQQALAVEKAVSAARGGAASRQALALALGHMGGSLDNADAFIQKIKDGQLGPKQLENFEAFLNGQRGASQAAGKDAYDNYQRMIDDAPDPGTKARLIRERSRLFSGMDGYGKSESAPAKAAAPAAAGGPSAGQRAQALQWARANPNDPRAAKIIQALGQ